MGTLLIIIICVSIILLIIGYLISTYNQLIRVKNEVKKNFSNIDILLKQRHDELPKLIDSCKAYMLHEKTVLTQLTKARSQVEQARVSGELTKIGAAETTMRKATMNLFAVAENYPDLKANSTFQHLQKRISFLENSISDRRELYNDRVAIFNALIEQIPGVFIAKPLSFNAFMLLEFTEEEKKDINVAQYFSS